MPPKITEKQPIPLRLPFITPTLGHNDRERAPLLKFVKCRLTATAAWQYLYFATALGGGMHLVYDLVVHIGESFNLSPAARCFS